MSGSTEIERKFLVEARPANLEGAASVEIEQGYLAVGEEGVEVRLRRAGSERVLTFKQGRGRTRREEQLALDAGEFERLWPLTEDRRIAKTRHAIDGGGGVTIELDVYAGAHDGLMVAEVEFDSEEAADAFAPPDWFGPEVTDDPRYKNRSLAERQTPPGG